MTELPEVVVKNGKMSNYWSTRMKAVALLLLFLIYIYVLIFVKTLYLKTKRLDRIMAMALEAENDILEVHSMDQNIVLKMQHIQDAFEAY